MDYFRPSGLRNAFPTKLIPILKKIATDCRGEVWDTLQYLKSRNEVGSIQTTKISGFRFLNSAKSFPPPSYHAPTALPSCEVFGFCNTELSVGIGMDWRGRNVVHIYICSSIARLD